ncbi:MAG: C25 family cysteine peptidase [Candidatus Sumerlaeia bacterium]|nr:C25 family cysteine peptidase [Candidatus Sumerlaeia bacterium]
MPRTQIRFAYFLVILLGTFLQVGCSSRFFSTSDSEFLLANKKDHLLFETVVEPVFESSPKRSWIFVVPEGDFTWRVERLKTVDLGAPGGLHLRSAKEVRSVTGLETLEGWVTVKDMGVWRNHRLVSMVVDTERTLPIRISGKKDQPAEQQTHRIVQLAVRIDFPNASSCEKQRNPLVLPETTEFLGTIVANPEGLGKYELCELPASPSEWQPVPTPWESTGIPMGSWRAIRIAESKLHVVDGRWLSESGLNTETLTPEQIRVWSRGKSVPLLLLQDDPSLPFSKGARVAFYALPSDSFETNERIYYVTTEAIPQREHLVTPLLTEDAPTSSTAFYNRLIQVEDDISLEKRYGSFLSIKELTWTWGKLVQDDPEFYNFDLPGLPTENPPAELSIQIYQALNGLSGTVQVELFVNENSLGTQEIRTGQTDPLVAQIPGGMLRRLNNTLMIRDVTTTPVATLANVQLDFFTVSQSSLFRGDEGILDVTFQPGDEAPLYPALQLSNFRTLQTRAIDLTDPENPRFHPLHSTATEAHLIGPFSLDQRILVVEQDRLSKPPVAEPIPVLSLPSESIRLLVVSHKQFLEQASALTSLLAPEYRMLLSESEADPLTMVQTVDVAALYHAYSGGELSSDAIRYHLAELIRRPEGEKLDHVILFGDCTSDGRRVTRNNVINYVPTRNSSHLGMGIPPSTNVEPFASDYWYGWLVGEDELSDLFISRISVNNPTDAAAYVEKVRAYQQVQQEALSPNSGESVPVSRRVFALSDAEGFSPAMDQAEQLFSPTFQVDHVRTYDAVWEDNYYLPESVLVEAISKVSPVVTRRIVDAFNGGVGTVLYMGHGSPNIWSNQRVWFGGDSPSSDNLLLQNAPYFPFVATFTCNNGAIDYPIPQWNITILEDMVRQPNGGAIAAFIPSGPGYTANHLRLLEGLIHQFNTSSTPSFGTLAESARLRYQSVMGNDDHSRMYLLLGAGSLNHPYKMHSIESAEKEMGRQVNLSEVRKDEENSLLLLRVRNPNSITVTVEIEGNFPSTLGGFIRPYETVEYQLPIPQGVDSLLRGTLKTKLGAIPFLYGMDSDRQLYPESLSINPVGQNWDSNQLQVLVANTTDVEQRFSVLYDFGTDDLPTTGQSGWNTLLPGEQRVVSLGILPSTELSLPLPVSLSLQSMNTQGEISLLLEEMGTLENSQVPDLVIVPEELRVQPDRPTAGATVFVEGYVENRGGTTAPTSEVRLFPVDAQGVAGTTALRSRAPHPLSRIGVIAPGERAFFRTRWDPEKESGEVTLSIAVDSGSRILESDRSNNRAEVGIAIRSKWDLVPAGIGLRPTNKPGIVQLIATVRNQGQSDAHEVVVLYYRNNVQTEANLIGQVSVPIVKAETEVPFVLELDVQTLNLNQEFLPSYAISLRGSRQRISSVTD